MQPPAATIHQLRQLLAERFPAAPPRHGLFIPTGVPPLDEALGGGLWKGTLAEIGTAPGAIGCLTLFTAILFTCALKGRPVALIDGADNFDPQPIDQDILSRLLWVRCRDTTQSLKAADLLLRDGNLPLILLYLRGNSPAELRKIPNTTWYRLQRIVAGSAVACLIATPRFMVGSAHYRLQIQSAFRLADLDRPIDQLLAKMDIQVTRRHGLAGANTPAAI